MKISVIIPVYNIKAYLNRCVQSVLQQEPPPCEVLLIDDGSTDGSGELCDSLSRQHAVITVHHKSNGGLSSARNYGLSKAQGQYILFLDGDDFLAENALKNLGEDALRHSPDMVIGRCQPLKPTKSMQRFEAIAQNSLKCHCVYTGREYLRRCLKGGAVRVEAWRSLYAKKFLTQNCLSFEPNRMHEDELFTPQALLCAEKIVLSNAAFYCYDNTRENSIMNAPGLARQKALDRFWIYDRLIMLYKTVRPRSLRRLLLDDVSWKYIDCYTTYCQKEALVRPKRLSLIFMACKPKRKMKSTLFALSPKLYLCLKKGHSKFSELL